MAVEVAPTYDKIVQLWWAYYWRFFGLGFLIELVLSVIYLTMDQVLGIKTQHYMISIAVIIIGTVVSQWVFHRLLTKGFGRYRLVLIEK
ncbi:MAG TPA: hypothetical protein VL625_03990 [Patescibacteria group bacterium]|jgi:hypothetical protein|nr:hypothetical protein [Patescibacteria group bacterium]